MKAHELLCRSCPIRVSSQYEGAGGLAHPFAAAVLSPAVSYGRDGRVTPKACFRLRIDVTSLKVSRV